MAKNTNWQDMLEEWFMKLPSLPKGGRDFMVQAAPWVALVGGVFAVLGGIAVFGFSAIFSPLMLMSGIGFTTSSFLSGVILLVAGAIMLMAFPLLKARKMKGWNLYFWSVLVWAVSSLADWHVLTALFWTAVELYLLYQIKSYYKS